MLNLTCQFCGQPFSSATRNRKFCGRTCANRDRASKATRFATYHCRECGCEVQTKPRNIGKHAYCKPCRDRLHGERLNANREPPITLTCAQCGEPFTVLKCFDHRKYCSHECYAASRVGKPHPAPRIAMPLNERKQRDLEKARKFRERKHAEWDALPKIPCACGCGATISPIGKLGKPVRYMLGHNPINHDVLKGRPSWNKGICGPDSHSWRNGCSRFPYGFEFSWTLKKLIRERDHYTCQRCGKTQEQLARTLHVHHIDHDKLNNDPTNLVTVCNACNVWFSFHRDEPFARIAESAS